MCELRIDMVIYHCCTCIKCLNFYALHMDVVEPVALEELEQLKVLSVGHSCSHYHVCGNKP